MELGQQLLLNLSDPYRPEDLECFVIIVVMAMRPAPAPRRAAYITARDSCITVSRKILPILLAGQSQPQGRTTDGPLAMGDKSGSPCTPAASVDDHGYLLIEQRGRRRPRANYSVAELVPTSDCVPTSAST
ncbi:hypothetical protein EVAR_59794_1 [Eumeta japonica]|uniref:Uncharacterized protein n=1 Tax=Eumeta variegata TaxID=151549 RepID=A0A4C1YEY4_EUMVA|nr:hypothetical protein EVAR_59794_1 [Eumeta japonica]